MSLKMKWTAEKDDLLLREMFSERPWTKRGGSTDRSLSWERIADVLNLLDGFNINQRSVRDRFTHLLNKYKQKRAAEHRASGIVPEHTQLDDYLEELDSLFSEAEREKDDDNKKKREKTEEDKLKAIEFRQLSMETFSETRKRNLEGSPVENNAKRSRKNDVLNYLAEKNEKELDLKRKKLELKERELEIRKQEADNITQQLNRKRTT